MNNRRQGFLGVFLMLADRRHSLIAPAVLAALTLLAFSPALLSQTRGPASAPPAAAASKPGRGPAPTLTAPTTPSKTPGADGFIQRWLLLEPISVSGALTDSAVQALVKEEHFPGQFTEIPRDGDKVKAGDAELAWHAVDTKNYNVNLYHFAYALNRPTSNVLFWAVTIINCPKEMRDVRLAIGSNAASVWWVNGKEVIGIYGDRQAVIDDGVSRRLTLNKGPNILRAAIVNAGGATDFCARFLDTSDRPVRDFTVSVIRPEE